MAMNQTIAYTHVVCDSCNTGLAPTWASETKAQWRALHPGVAAATVTLTCDLGSGGTKTFTQPTNSNGAFVIGGVPSRTTYKDFQSCAVKLTGSCPTASQSCRNCGTCSNGDVGQVVLNATGGTWLQAGATYKVGPYCFTPDVPPPICSAPVAEPPPPPPSAGRAASLLKKPDCSGGRSGALCGDPRLVGGDGVPFWFHGKKDADFCIVSDRSLQVNAHFIGKPAAAAGAKHDFTWVQAIAMLFGKHKLYVGALQEATWTGAADHLVFILDGEPLLTVSQTGEEAVWESKEAGVTILRPGKPNLGMFVVKDLVRMTVEVKAIARVNWTDSSCFAHIDMSMDFAQLSSRAEGVLGQTYQKLWTAPNGGAGEHKSKPKAYILHDADSYETTSLFEADCRVSIFEGLGYARKEGAESGGDGGAGWRRGVMDDEEEPDDVAEAATVSPSSRCSNNPMGSGLKCVSR
eukprot:SM000242S08494  [mRNA]  locus=s242:132785:135808:- [translate_table: standard]